MLLVIRVLFSNNLVMEQLGSNPPVQQPCRRLAQVSPEVTLYPDQWPCFRCSPHLWNWSLLHLPKDWWVQFAPLPQCKKPSHQVGRQGWSWIWRLSPFISSAVLGSSLWSGPTLVSGSKEHLERSRVEVLEARGLGNRLELSPVSYRSQCWLV